VKQCEHCRGARKSKSHHAKCDCGDKKDRPKEKGDATGMLCTTVTLANHANNPPAHDTACQCHSGAKCLCGSTKGLDLRLDTGRQTLHEARAKPKLSATHSESHLTVFANGHHKPCHRNNNSAHVAGLPYKIPRPHTLHGHSAFSSLTQSNKSYSKRDVPAPRSMDTLSLSNNDFYAMFGSTPQSADSLPLNPVLDGLPFQEHMFGPPSETFGQEGESPGSSVSDSFATQPWPWASTPVTGTFAYGSLSTSPSQDSLPNLGNDWSIPSGFNPLWSAGDLPLDPSKFSDGLTQPISHSGESKHSGPGLTIASSAHSEVGEPNPFELDLKAPSSSASESLFWEDSPVYRFTSSMPSEGIEAPVPLPVQISMAGILEPQPTFAKSVSAAPMAMTSPAPSEYGETAAMSMPSNFQDITPMGPWPLDSSNGTFSAMNNFDLNYSNPNWF